MRVQAGRGALPLELPGKNLRFLHLPLGAALFCGWVSKRPRRSVENPPCA